MKLLQPKEAKQSKEKEEAIKRIRTAELQNEYEKKLRLLNNLNDDFIKALKAQQDAWVEEKEAHRVWRETAQAEMDAFKRGEQIALIPIEERENEIHTGQSLFLEALSLLESQKEEVEELRTSFHRRLAEVGERETEAKALERQLEARQKGIEAQGLHIQEQSARFTASLEQLSLASTARERELNTRKTELDSIQDSFAIREANMTKREQELVEKEYRLGLYKLTLERNYKKQLED